jgi:IS5 family transposase
MAARPAADYDAAMRKWSFAIGEYAGKKRQARRDRFFAEMNSGVPWSRLQPLIEPHYTKSGKVNRPGFRGGSTL